MITATDITKNLLVIDDEDGQLQTLRDIFTDEGFDVCACTSFEDAVDRCQDHSFSVVILDLRLGREDGIELLRQLQQTQPGIRAIIHTGYGTFDSARDAVNLGAFAYVEKRGNPAELVGQVNRAVRDCLSEALTQSEQRYRDLLNDVVAIVWECELPTWRFTFVSHHAESILGYPIAQWFAEPDFWINRVHVDDRERCIKLCMGSAERGEDHEFDYRAIAADGRTVWLHDVVRVVKDSEGLPYKLRGVMFDITERKNSEERFRQLAENVNAVVWMRSADGRKQLYVSPRYEEIWGRSLDSLKENSESFLDAVFQEDRPRVRKAVESLINGGKAEEYDVEYRIERGDGEIRWIRDHGFSIRNHEGDIIRQAGFAEDVTESQNALEQMRIRGRAIADANVGIIISDATQSDHPVIYCNPTFQQLTGYSKQEVVGRNCRFLQNEDREQNGVRVMHEAVAKGRRCTVVVRNYRKDGRMFWNEISIAPIRDENGRLTHFVGFMNDVTDRIEAEQILRESESSLAKAQRIARMGSWELDLATGHVSGSPEMLRILGIPDQDPPSTVESFVSDFVHSDDFETVTRLIQRASESGETETLEFRFRRRSDHHVCFARAEAEIIYGEDGSRQKIIGTLQDITQQKRTELALRESESKFRGLAEKSPAIVLIARGDQFLYCNPMLSVVTGYSNEELLRMRMQDVVHPEFRELIADRHRRRLNGEEVPHQYESKIVTKSGEDRWVDVSAQRIEFEGDPAVLVTCVNVTERRLAEEALRQSEERLREVNASLERRVAERTADLKDKNAELAAFAHSVSHDLRSPLRAMEGFAVALAEDYGQQIDENGHEFIQHIVDSAKRMDVLVDDLLAYSRLGRTEIRASAIRLNSIMREALSQLGSEIKACNAEVDVAESMGTVLGHRATLLQVVTNLISNAMKFVADGVRPKVRIWSERRDDGMIRLWCEDNGIGIDSACQDRIFRVFERLHGIESYPGTGIGLAIVARACERLGGRCGFESQLGQGSRFWGEFPAGEEDR